MDAISCLNPGGNFWQEFTYCAKCRPPFNFIKSVLKIYLKDKLSIAGDSGILVIAVTL